MTQVSSFTATSHTLEEIFRSGQGLYVPVYQRPYTWGTDQVDRLFEDILAGIDRAADALGPPTFLGSTILFEGRNAVHPKINTALPVQVLHVVDGQQRLTTLLLILGRVRDHVLQVTRTVEKLDSSSERDWVHANLLNLAAQLEECLWVEQKSASGAFTCLPRLIRQSEDVWGDRETNASYVSDIAFFLHDLAKQHKDSKPPAALTDRSHLKLIVTCIDEQLQQVVDGSIQHSMLADLEPLSDLSTINHLLPRVLAQNAINKSGISRELLEAIRVAIFAEFLLRYVVLIDVRAPNEDTAFSLFEPLNTTGQPLNPIETLRPLVVAAEGGLETFQDSPSDRAFQRVYQYVSDDLDFSTRSRRASSLLTSFALGQDGEKLNTDATEQRRYLRQRYDSFAELSDKRQFVRGIADTAAFFSDVWEEANSPVITLGSPADRLSLEVLRSSNHIISVPLLVRYFEKAQLISTDQAAEEFRQVVRAIAAFWTLWRTSHATTKGIDTIHRGLMRAGLPELSIDPLARLEMTLEQLPAASKIKEALRHLLNARLAVSDASSWSLLVNSQQIYETAKVLSKYIIMCAHDDAIDDLSCPGLPMRGAQSTSPVLSVEVWRANYTIEHIAPQQRKAGDNSYSSNLYDEANINRLGNLTLLPANLNSLLGNKPWPFKRKVFEMVSQTNSDLRIAFLDESDLSALPAKSRRLLESTNYISFCRFVATHDAETFSRDYVRERGVRLAELAWERLWADLN